MANKAPGRIFCTACKASRYPADFSIEHLDTGPQAKGTCPDCSQTLTRPATPDEARWQALERPVVPAPRSAQPSTPRATILRDSSPPPARVAPPPRTGPSLEEIELARKQRREAEREETTAFLRRIGLTPDDQVWLSLGRITPTFHLDRYCTALLSGKTRAAHQGYELRPMIQVTAFEAVSEEYARRPCEACFRQASAHPDREFRTGRPIPVVRSPMPAPVSDAAAAGREPSLTGPVPVIGRLHTVVAGPFATLQTTVTSVDEAEGVCVGEVVIFGRTTFVQSQFEQLSEPLP